MGEIVTPALIEKRLLTLSKELDEAHDELVAAERQYHQAKVTLEISLARARLSSQGNGTVQDRQDRAVVMCAEHMQNLGIAEAVAKAARANANRLRAQVDIVRSIGTSVRASLEVS